MRISGLANKSESSSIRGSPYGICQAADNHIGHMALLEQARQFTKCFFEPFQVRHFSPSRIFWMPSTSAGLCLASAGSSSYNSKTTVKQVAVSGFSVLCLSQSLNRSNALSLAVYIFFTGVFSILQYEGMNSISGLHTFRLQKHQNGQPFKNLFSNILFSKYKKSIHFRMANDSKRWRANGSLSTSMIL